MKFDFAPILIAVMAAAFARDRKETALFRAKHPCPATNEPSGKCPGYVVDHIVPLCAGGADHISNMQWQTRAEAKQKDARERRYCRCLKKPHATCPVNGLVSVSTPPQ